MPGRQLMAGVDQVQPIEDVSVNIVYGLWETTKYCNSRLAQEEKYGLITLNCITNGCIVLGCATAYRANGKVYACDIYAAWDADFIVAHELEHCRGYADALY